MSPLKLGVHIGRCKLHFRGAPGSFGYHRSQIFKKLFHASFSGLLFFFFRTLQKQGVITFFITYFYYSSITFTVCGESKLLFTSFQIFSLLSQPSKILIQVFTVLKPDIICTFLIHYGSLQKMLTALFDFLWNTQKRNWTNFFEWPGKMLLSIEKLSLSFMPYVGPKWNIYLSHYCAKFEHKV